MVIKLLVVCCWMPLISCVGIPHSFGGFTLKKQAQPQSMPQGGGIAVRGGLRLKVPFRGGGKGI